MAYESTLQWADARQVWVGGDGGMDHQVQVPMLAFDGALAYEVRRDLVAVVEKVIDRSAAVDISSEQGAFMLRIQARARYLFASDPLTLRTMIDRAFDEARVRLVAEHDLADTKADGWEAELRATVG